jgi:putative transposase
MPWKETSPMRERLDFLRDHASGLFNFGELCLHYGVSRKTGYKWLKRFGEEGPQGLQDRSRRPHTSPHQIDQRVVDVLLEAKQRHPCYGPKKIKSLLELERPSRQWPAASMIGELFKKHGLVKHRRRHRRPGHPGHQPRELTFPNQLWTADFKGEFKTRDGALCYPLTIADGYSRYLLAVEGLPGPRHKLTQAVFERAFTDFGFPYAIQTDNGVPFASLAIHRLSRLQVWWIKLGITPVLIEPASPYQNGSHECMHRTLKQATALPPAEDGPAQQLAFDRFRHDYNEIRPHEALDQTRPASHYHASFRPYPAKVPEPEYPAHFQVRKVAGNGGISWHTGWINISRVLCGEYVGLEEVAYKAWSVYFGWS